MGWTESLNRLAASLTEHRPSLYPDEERDDLADIKIGKLSVEGFSGESRSYALAVKAGLHLFNESLDRSHDLSQEIHNPTGSYWHGIMHRMEGDYGNAKYWFRLVGHHPVFVDLGEAAKQAFRSADWSEVANASLREQLQSFAESDAWDPYRFIDLVEQQVTRARDEAAERWLTHIQWLEMKLLLQYSYAQSGGEGRLVEIG